MNLKSLAAGRSDLSHINPAIIQVDPTYNLAGRHLDPTNDPRDARLVQDIRARGVRTALVVRLVDEKVFVVQGHRRLQAVKLLSEAGVDIKTVPCVPEPRGTNDADRNLDLIMSNDDEANGSKPITEIQRAEAFVRQLRYGWTEAEIAEAVGCSEQTVRNQIAIHELPTPIKRMVEADKVSVSEAVKVVRSEGGDAKVVLDEALEIAKAEGKERITPKFIAKVDTKAAAKKAERTAARAKPETSEVTTAAPATNTGDAKADAKADALATLDTMVKTLSKLESNPQVNPRAREAIEKARIRVADAFDITDQN